MTTTPPQMTIDQRKQAVNRLHVRLVQSLVIYGLLIAAASAMIGTIYSPGIDMPPRRLIGVNAIATVIGSGAFTLIFLVPVLRWIGGRAEESRILPIWLLIGLTYGIFSVFLTGASLPFVFAFQINLLNFTSMGTLIDDLIDSLFRAPLSAFTYGVFALYIGFIAGLFYGVGAWIIDMLNRMNYPYAYSDPWIEAVGDILPTTRRWASAAAPWLSSIGPWVIALVVGGAMLLFAVTGPMEFLARLRLG